MQRDISAELQMLKQRLGNGQAEMARQAGVSQSTISRVMRRGYLRHGSGRERIEKFLDDNASILHKPKDIPAILKLALEEVWDKTPGHARILASVIRATDGLVPKK